MPFSRRTPDSTEKLVVELTKDRVTAADIAKITNLNVRTVQRIRSRKEATLGPRQERISPEKLGKIKSMLDERASFVEISRTLHTTPETIARHFPDAKPWTPEESYMFGAQVSSINRRARRADRNNTMVTVV